MTVDLRTGFADGHGHDRLISFESVVGSRFDDVLYGNLQGVSLLGREGDDIYRDGMVSIPTPNRASRFISTIPVSAMRPAKA